MPASFYQDTNPTIATIQALVNSATASASAAAASALNASTAVAGLITSGGGNFTVTINKANTAATADVQFQDNTSPRAQCGLIGDDNFHIQVSALGVTWIDALVITTAGVVAAATATAGTATTQVATTAFVAASFAPLASPALTGTPTAPTVTPGDNSTKLATTAFVAASYAPLASPALTGNPTAPTQSPGDNSTKLANTAFMQAALSSYAPINNPALTGAPTAPTAAANDASTKLATTAYVDRAQPLAPGGRLSLTSGVPVMTASASAQGTLYYIPYKGGNKVPVYDGVDDDVLTFASLSTAMASTGTGVLNAASVFDAFIINVSGVATLVIATNGSGGGWASDTGGSNTARGTGYSQLDFLSRPYPTNKNSMSTCYNGTTVYSVAANQGTYVGTIMTDTASAGKVSWTFGSAAAGGGAGWFGVYNYYNRVYQTSAAQDSTSSWSYLGGVRAANASNTIRTTIVIGVSEDTVDAYYSIFSSTGTTTNSSAVTYIGLDSITSPVPLSTAGDLQTNSALTVFGTLPASYKGRPGVGQHYLTALESATVSAATFFASTISSLAVGAWM